MLKQTLPIVQNLVVKIDYSRFIFFFLNVEFRTPNVEVWFVLSIHYSLFKIFFLLIRRVDKIPTGSFIPGGLKQVEVVVENTAYKNRITN